MRKKVILHILVMTLIPQRKLWHSFVQVCRTEAAVMRQPVARAKKQHTCLQTSLVLPKRRAEGAGDTKAAEHAVDCILKQSHTSMVSKTRQNTELVSVVLCCFNSSGPHSDVALLNAKRETLLRTKADCYRCSICDISRSMRQLTTKGSPSSSIHTANLTCHPREYNFSPSHGADDDARCERVM